MLLTACSEGRGFHSLLGETGAKLYQNWGDTILFKGQLKRKTFGLFSPNLNQTDINHLLPQKTIFSQNFNEMVSILEDLYGESPKVGIFPCSNQLTK